MEQWLIEYPTPNSVPPNPYIPACSPTGLYRAIAYGGTSSTSPPQYADFSNEFFVVASTVPCISSVTLSPAPVGQGDPLTISWAASNQNRYTVQLYNSGGLVSTIAGPVTSGAQSHVWPVPQGQAPGTYRIKLTITSSANESSAAYSAWFDIQNAPTIANVAFSPSSLYAGDTLHVTWSSTQQTRWELYYCAGSSCNGPVQSGNTSAQSADWVTPTNLTGTYKVALRVFSSSGRYRDGFSTGQFTLLARPSVTVGWQFFNTHVNEAPALPGQPNTVAPAVVVHTSNGGVTPVEVRVAFETQDIVAQAGVDYSYRAGEIVVPAGSNDGTSVALTATQAVVIGDDTLDEFDEHFRVLLTSASGASLDSQHVEHVVYIVDDDPLPTLSVNDVSVVEGDGVTTAATFTVTLVGGTGRGVPFSVSTSNGTAVAGADYGAVAQSDNFGIGSGTRTKTYTVNVTGDLLDEDDETFVLNLTNVQNATVLDSQGLGSIADNDPLPVLSIAPTSVSEGTGGTNQAVFTATLTPVSGRTVILAYGTTPGTATAPQDYGAVTGNVQFAPGQLTGTFAVPLVTDNVHEPDEAFAAYLGAPWNAVISPTQGQAAGTITNDDPLPAISIADASVVEQAGTAQLKFTLSLANPSSSATSVAWATADGTALAGQDYVAASNVAAFAAGQTSGTVAIDIPGDITDEDDETLLVNLSNPAGGTVADAQGIGTIVDDDPLPVLAFDDVSVTEGDSGHTPATFTATVTPPSGKTVRASYATTATNDVKESYHPVSGELLFRPGVASLQVPVAVIGDRRFEGDATFTLALSTPFNAILAPGGGSGYIVDDDVDAAAVSDVSVVEPRAGVDRTAQFMLSGPSTGPLVVRYSTVDATAHAGSDYGAVSGQLTLLPGTPAIVDVPLLPDAVDEAPEAFGISVRDASTGVELASGTAKLYDRAVGGDLDADGRLDITWRDSATGALSVWLLNDFTLREEAPTTPAALPDLGWRGVGSADFNADGSSDILLRNAVSGKTVVWYMDGLVRTSGVFTNPDGATDLAWMPVGTGDFNADHRPDILWYNVTSGKTVVWLMDGVTRTEGQFTTPDGVTSLAWKPQGVGDFDGDGDADIMWRNANSGNTSLWFMNGLVRDVGLFLTPTETDLDWEVAGVGDYDRDGRSDVLWRRGVDGTLRAWTLDGTLRLSSYGFQPASRAPTWEVIGPR